MIRKGSTLRQRTRFLILTLSSALFPSTTTSFSTRNSLLTSGAIVSNRHSSFIPVTGLSQRERLFSKPALHTSYFALMSTAADNGDKCVPANAMTLSSASSLSDDGSLIDKSLFDQNIRLVAINIPAKLCTVYLNEFKDFLLKRPRIKRIYDAEKDGVRDNERRLIVLTEDMGDDLELPKLPESLKAFNVENNGVPEIFMLKVSYENIAVEDVLRKILPAEVVEIPSSFEQVGHIAHLNLREEVLQYKKLIGEEI
jgi:hypothetical protein